MKLTRLSTAAFAMGLLAPLAAADLTLYDQDCEGLNAADPAALTNEGFLGFANVFDPGGGYLYGYGTFGAPNGGPGFSAIASGSGGPDQGLQYLNIYSDYNNGDHANGNYIDALVFREQSVGAANVGETWTFEFDYLKNPTPTNGDGDTTTRAFVKVLKVSDGSFATLAEVTLDTTGASDTTWATGSLDLLIDPAHQGEIVQFGFASYATLYNDSGRFYDNLSWSTPGGSPPSLSVYAQDFETLNAADPAALTAEGYKIFANVFDPGGGYLYGYGVFDAPNGGPGFSVIDGGVGGPYQGTQYLNIYSDYNNADHGNGNYIEALVFQEQVIGTVDAGTDWRFGFDYLRNPVVTNGQGDSTMKAFIKVLKQSDGSFATLAELSRDMTGANDTIWASSGLDITIDPSWDGELLQFGFQSFATNYNDTGRFYDNISFAPRANSGLGEVLCLGNPSSIGVASDLFVTGSAAVADNDVTLNVVDLPLNQMGYFLHSPETQMILNPGGFSEGHICIFSSMIGRFSNNVFDSGATGAASLAIDLTGLPAPFGGPVMVMAGETRYFQYWTRDFNGGMQTSNFSSAMGVTFQ